MPSPKLSRLEAQKAAIEAQLRQERAREKTRQDKLNGRRRAAAGGAVLDEAEENPEFHAALMKLLGRRLTRPYERELFDLPLLVQADSNVHELVQPERAGDDPGERDSRETAGEKRA